MKSHWITHQGKQILFCDYTRYSHADFDALKTELDAVVDLILREPERSVLAISDVRNSVATRPVVRIFKEAATIVSNRIRKQAVVGVTGLKGIIFDAVVRVSGQPARAFGDLEMEEAKKWLVEED